MPLLNCTEDCGASRGSRSGPPPAAYTVDEAIEAVGFGWPQLRIYLVCKSVMAIDAMEIMLLSLAGPAIHCDWQLEGSQLALISTAVFLGMAVSAPFMGMLADRYGRRNIMVLGTFLTAYFGLLTAFSLSYLWLLVTRALVGLGIGALPQSISLAAEFIPFKFRAKLMVAGELFWVAGSLFQVLLAALVTPTLGWRWLIGISAFPIFLVTLACLMVPESTRYLVAAGQREEALTMLQRLSTLNKRPLPHGTLAPSRKIPLASWRDLFCPEYRRSTLLLWPIWFILSLTYFGIVLASPYLLADQNTSTNIDACHVLMSEEYVPLATSAAGEIVCTVLVCLLVDRVGRLWTWRVLVLVASVSVLLLLLAKAVDAGVVVTTFLISCLRGTTAQGLTVSYVYTVELYPTSMRALGLGVSSAFARVASTVTPFLAQMLLLYSVTITLVIYGALCVLAVVFMFLLPIETLRRPMMQTVSVPESDEQEAALTSHDQE